MMEDWRYKEENCRARLRSRSRSRSPTGMLRLRDRDYSPRRMNETVERCGGPKVGDHYRCGKQCESEIDMARVRGRDYRSIDCGGAGRDSDRMRVGDRRYFSKGREVELRKRDYVGRGGGGEYGRTKVGDMRHSPLGRDVGVVRERELHGCGSNGGEYGRTRAGDLRHSPRGREVEVLRQREYADRVGGGEYDQMRVGDRGYSPKGRAVEVVRDKDYGVCGGGEYDRMRIGERRCSPRRREMEAVRNGREYDRAKFLVEEYSGKTEICPTWSVTEHKRKIIDHKFSPNQQEMEEPRIGEEYEERIAMSKYSLMRLDIDEIRSGKQYEGSWRLDQESPMLPVMERRIMDERMPGQVELRRDYDKVPPDIMNKGGDHDDEFPWSMRLSRDDDRGLERDHVNTNGVSKNSSNRFDDSLSSMGLTPSKFQNNSLEEHRTADTVRSYGEFGVRDARVYGERDNNSKQFLDVGLSECFLDTNRMLVKSDSRRGSSYSCPSDNIVSKHYGVESRGHLLMPHPKSSYQDHVALHGDRYFDKVTGDRPFMEDKNMLESSKDEYNFIPTPSLSNVFSKMSSNRCVEEISPLVKEADNRGSGGVVVNCGISCKPLMCGRQCQNPLSASPIIYARQCSDNKCCPQTCLPLPEENKHSSYQEVGKRVHDHMSERSCDIYGNSCDFPENHGCQDMLRAQNQELDMDREKCQFSKQDHSSNGSLQWHLDPYSIRDSMPDYTNIVESSHVKKPDMDILDYGDPHLQYDTKMHNDSVPKQHLEYHDCGIDHGCHSHHDRSEIIRSGKYYPKLDGPDRSPTQNSFPHNTNLSEPPEMRLRHRHLKGSISCLSNEALQLSSSLPGAHQTKDERYIRKPCVADELDFFVVSKKSKYSSSRNEDTGNGCMDLSSRLTNRRKLSQPLQKVLSKDSKSYARDIKSRLGPSPQDAHASHSVAKKHKSSVKKRLGHFPNKDQVTLPWIKNLTAPKLSLIQKDSGGNHNQEEDILDSNGCCRVDLNLNDPKLSNIQQGSGRFLVQGGDCLEANQTFIRAEPEEKSEEFKQLVHSNFFKFVKQLNETLARRTKFLDHGKYGALKCLVCGSNSPEFPDTESLVVHALSCDKVGSKCQHLGFHKALCALMGWRSAEVPNDSWVCEMLTDAETSALKDDLIIWPAVVVVHNSTIADIPEKRVTLSVEDFEAKLRDMGFGDKTKVTLGRPASQGTMVVRFGQTFSALQEAERLHKMFLDFNRGRTGFLQLNSNSYRNYHAELPVAAGDELQPFLYGYVGLADDLDKLDFEIKRRSLIKSKTEIQILEDASGKKGVAVDATNNNEVIADATIR